MAYLLRSSLLDISEICPLTSPPNLGTIPRVSLPNYILPLNAKPLLTPPIDVALLTHNTKK